MPKQYINPKSTYFTDAYSHAVRVGDTIYLSGVVGVDKEGNTLGDGGVVAEIDGAYENLKATLTAAGAALEDLVSTRVYLTSADDFEVYKQTREKWLTHPGPTLTVLIVKALGRADLLFELEAVAVVD